VELATQGPESEEFRVQLDLFEGPLDLLLFLIRKNELEITELALARVTGQYLAYLALFQSMSISVASDYLLHAATLVELKSSMLLPRPEAEAAAEGESASEELLRRLREHEHLRAAAEQLAALHERALLWWARPPEERDTPTEWVVTATAAELCYALEGVLRLARRKPVHEVRLDEWSVTEKIRELTLALAERRRVDVTGLLGAAEARGEKVAVFLAALELAKRSKEVRLLQGAAFGNIELLREDV
jgi:segregation and condensation protein A